MLLFRVCTLLLALVQTVDTLDGCTTLMIGLAVNVELSFEATLMFGNVVALGTKGFFRTTKLGLPSASFISLGLPCRVG